MHISKRNAMAIVSEISGIIGENINMMNSEGIIIASTDSARVGTYHEAAKKIIDENLGELIIYSDDAYEGTKSGANLAINFNDEIVGVIGVTGHHSQVVKYGQIIKKMTEILIKDQYIKEQRDIDRRVRERFLEEWICSDRNRINNAFVSRGLALGIDVTQKYRIIVFAVRSLDPEKETAQNTVEHCENEIVKTLKCHALKSGFELICAVPSQGDGELVRQVKKLKTQSEAAYPVSVFAGIDSCAENNLLVQNAYKHASKALRTCIHSPSGEPRLYSSINMEIFVSELSDKTKEEYIRSIFKGYTADEIDVWMNILDTLYKNEGSITKTAEQLFIHKNTLQYRLHKLMEQTGYDPRSIRFSSLFYNAIHFYADVKDKLLNYNY